MITVQMPPIKFSGEAEKFMRRHVRRLRVEWPGETITAEMACRNLFYRAFNAELRREQETAVAVKGGQKGGRQK